MSFGLGKEDTPTQATKQSSIDAKIESYKEEMSKNANLFVKKREETLLEIKRNESNTSINVRKSKTPLRFTSNTSTVPEGTLN
jgi:hypothetical protein